MTKPLLLHPRYNRGAAASHNSLPTHTGADKRLSSGANGRARALFRPILQYRRSKRTRALITLVGLAFIVSALIFLFFGVVFPASLAPLRRKVHTELSPGVNASLAQLHLPLRESRSDAALTAEEHAAIMVPGMQPHAVDDRPVAAVGADASSQHEKPAENAPQPENDHSDSQQQKRADDADKVDANAEGQQGQADDTESVSNSDKPEEQSAQAVNADPETSAHKPAELSDTLNMDSDAPHEKATEDSVDSAAQQENAVDESAGTGKGEPIEENVKILVDTAQPVRADVSALAKQREKADAAPMSIVVLFHNEYDSMKTSLKSWLENGLIDYTQEILFFLNGVESDREFLKQITQFEQIPKEKRRIHVSAQNLPLGKAITKMVELASSEYVLLLEKDWKLIEPPHITKSRLIDSKVLISSGAAHLVRHRHRHDPGVPLHALIMHQGREESIIRQQANLLCFVHHWQDDPPNAYPGKGIMYRCGGPERNVDEEDVYCSPSKYCQWNNNPGLFKRKWFLDEIGKEYLKQYKIEYDKHGIESPFLDFEYYTNWRSYAWSDKNFTIAVGTGLFSHAESEHQYFNTFWYAHYRLETDLEEVRNQYLRNETHFKQLGGVHFDPAYPKPLNMMERYPVEFVRKFQYPDMYIGTVDTQRKMIDEYYQDYLRDNRVLTEEEWQRSGGADSKKAKAAVNWRVHITKLHTIVEKAMMNAPVPMPYEMNITLVTCLLDIGRDSLDDDVYQFRRDFKMYLDAMQEWLRHKYKKVVYTSKQIADELLKGMNEESKASTKFVYISREDLRTKWIGVDNYEKIQEIRQSKEWTGRASWLSNAPQARLKDYNPLVMSKMYMMRDAARQNLWNTTHFLFFDSKHNCRRVDIMHDKNDHILRAHMMNKLLLTTFDYTAASEVHGFEASAFKRYCNRKNPTEQQAVRVGRGGIFGGSAFVLEYITAMYDVALTATLREGLMGTEENVLSIVKYQVPQYVDEFSNNWACADKIEKDHYCESMRAHQGYNCAIIDWMARDAVRAEA